MKKPKDNLGFTLIELLVVVALIGLLASIVLGSVYRVRSQANDATAIRNSRLLTDVLETYHQSQGSYPSGIYRSNLANEWSAFAAVLQQFVVKLPIRGTEGNRTDILYSYFGPNYVYFLNGIPAPTPNCIQTKNGYLLLTRMNDFTNAQKDNGINPTIYELFGGDFIIGRYVPGGCQ